MSDSNETERYIDPNSGAASQPGGFVSPGAQPVESAGTGDADEAYEGAQEHSAAPAGDQPGGQTGDDAGVDAQPDADADDASGDDGDDEENGEEESVKDYTELLKKNVPEIQAYLDEHPDEADAVKTAEIDRAGDDARKGILNHEA